MNSTPNLLSAPLTREVFLAELHAGKYDKLEFIRLPNDMMPAGAAALIEERKRALKRPINAHDAMAKLKAAFPNEYVTLKVEMAAHRNFDGTRTDLVEFSCYAASVGHFTAKTLDTALAMILEKSPVAGHGDAAGEMDRIARVEATYPAMTVEEIAP